MTIFGFGAAVLIGFNAGTYVLLEHGTHRHMYPRTRQLKIRDATRIQPQQYPCVEAYLRFRGHIALSRLVR